MKVTLAISYPEGAAMALARGFARRGQLKSLLIPSRRLSRLLAKGLSFVPLRNAESITHRVNRGLAREVTGVKEINGRFEVKRYAAKFLRRMGMEFQFLRIEKLKQGFSRSVARQIVGKHGADVLIGMAGSSLEAFSSVGSKTMRVLHVVDAPPWAHNEALERYYPMGKFQKERVSDWSSDRFMRELELSDLVLTPSTVVTREILRVLSEKPILQVQYGVDLAEFNVVTGVTSVASSKINILYIGQISQRKGIPFLSAACQDADFNVTLVGPIVDKDLLQDFPQCFQYLGTVAHAQLRNILSATDALVIPSIEDACPLVVFESLGAGVPVLGSSVVGSLENVTSPDSTIFTPGDVPALRAALLGVSKLSNLDRSERAHRVREENSPLISWDEYTDRVLDGISSKYIEWMRQGEQ